MYTYTIIQICKSGLAARAVLIMGFCWPLGCKDVIPIYWGTMICGLQGMTQPTKSDAGISLRNHNGGYTYDVRIALGLCKGIEPTVSSVGWR